MAFLAQGRAGFLCLEARGLFADREGGNRVFLGREAWWCIPRPGRGHGAHRVGPFSVWL